MISTHRSIVFLVPRWFLLLACFLAGPVYGDQAHQGTADTRVLIDVSGSMKTNDPDNLRRPALRLLVGLLPPNTRAGVWTFGQYVNMQVPLGKVDEAWREKARKGAGEIHSRGLFTNIEDAIRRSIADWEGVSKRYRRHLVLLTDGMVDISKNPAENTASRKRILEQLLPRLKEYQAGVYTIALSERADHELMKTLSSETNGWYEQVNDASQLQRIFLRIFEKVGRPDTVPLKGNRFQIDDSIQEATLLVFRSGEATPTRITTPEGKQFDFKNPPANVRWHRDEGYDLMTISDPRAGEWQIEAAMDPDNRVMVVTDLKMMTSELPARMLMGERVPLFVHFSNQGEKIIEQAFLDVVNVKAEQQDAGGPGEPRPVFDDGQGEDVESGDGIFSLLIGEGLQAGRAELIVNAEGRTFQRQEHQRFELLSPVSVAVIRDQDSGFVTVQLTPDSEALDPRSVVLDAGLVASGHDTVPVLLQPSEDGSVWETQVDQGELSGEWTLGIRLSATTLSGRQLALDLEPIAISGAAPAEPVAEAVLEPETVELEAAEPSAPEQASSDWVMDAMIFAAGNLVALILVAAGYWVIRRRRARDNIVLLDDETEDLPGDED